MRSSGVAAVLVVLLAAACGGRQAQATREMQDFKCKDRGVQYTITGHMSGAELGVQMDCAFEGPRIKRWRVDKQGTRTEDARSMTPGEFDDVWSQIGGIGWENLKNCTNGTEGKNDPLYKWVIKDDQNSNAFECQSVTAPFPYNSLVDPLDIAAARSGRQLGDDEPADLKKYEKKDKQK
jgi:hypothetical protein